MNKEQTEQLLADVAEIKKAVTQKKPRNKSWVSIFLKPWFWFWLVIFTVLVLGGSLADLSGIVHFGGN